MAVIVLQGVPFGSVASLVVIAGTLVLFFILLALGGFVYKSVRGDGIEWPEEIDESETDDDVHRSREDDEWKYH